MSEAEIKPLFDIVFMLVVSFVMAIMIIYGLYKGLTIVWKQHRKSKILKKLQMYIDNKQFQKVISFDKEGLPIFIEISDKKVNKIVSL